MMKTLGILLSSVALITTTISKATADDNPLTLSIKLGAEYNSNLTVEDLDLDASVGGFLMNVDASVGYKFVLPDDSGLRIGYDFSQSLHKDFSDFDFQSHSFSGGYEKTLGDFTLSADYFYFDTSLNGDKLLTMQMFTPTISTMVTDSLYVQTAYTYYKKKFADFITRDASTNKFGGTAFYFFNRAQSYFNGSLHFLKENALSEALDYSSLVASIGMKTPLHLLGDGSVLKSSLHYSNRDYKRDTQITAEPRTEDRFQFRASVTKPILKNTILSFDYEYTDRQSNVAFANYKENRITIAMKYGF